MPIRETTNYEQARIQMIHYAILYHDSLEDDSSDNSGAMRDSLTLHDQWLESVKIMLRARRSKRSASPRLDTF